MIEVTLNEINRAFPVLQKLMEMKGLPVSTALRLRRIIKAVQVEIDNMQVTQNQLADIYCLPAEDGADTRAFKTNADRMAFNKDMFEAGKTTVQILAQPLKLKDFGVKNDDENEIFTVGDLIALEWLIPDEPEPSDLHYADGEPVNLKEEHEPAQPLEATANA